jgi:predicted ATPase/DNA-binding NarL/FixJ family response regulator/DNA-binding XRE family transcriptional regulator
VAVVRRPAGEPREYGTVAERLVRLRRRARLTQEQLARELGVAFSTVNRWERGHTAISPAAERRLADLENRLASTPSLAPTLPVPTSSFVGRRRELADLRALLASGTRLLCVTGPGGVGKTRLVVELVLRDQLEDVVFVALESVGDAVGVASAVRAAFGVRDTGGPGHDGDDVTRGLAAAVGDARRLLVLDGAEHLAGPVGELTRRLLPAVASLRIVVTSRVLIDVPGAASWRLPPMACPPPGATAEQTWRADAAALWLERARERSPFLRPADVPDALVADLCRHLDGLPLAVELTAGWVGTLSVAEIHDRRAALLDGTGTGRALSTVVRHSWRLLDADQQAFIAELIAFAGPFTLEDAAAVTGRPEAEATTVLRSLVESSWLAVHQSPADTRFSLLDTMRSFLEAESGPDRAGELARRHAEHFGDVADKAERGLAGAEVGTWVARVNAAAPDIERALGWAQATGANEVGLLLAGRLWRWWLISGRISAGRRWLDTFLARAGRRDDLPVARGRCAAALLAAENGAYHEAIGLAEPAQRTFEAHGRDADAALAATVIGSAERYLGDAAASRQAFEKALTLRRRSSDRRGVSVSLNNLALLELDAGNLGAAEALLRESIDAKRALDDPLSVAIGLSNLSTALIRAGKLAEAGMCLAEATDLAACAGNLQLAGSLRANRGDLAVRLGRWHDAATHYRAAADAQREGGHAHDVIVALVGLGRSLAHLDRADEGRRHLDEAAALARRTGNPDGLAKVRAALGEVDPVAAAEPDQPGPALLTRRQAQVLRVVAAGASNKEVAAALGISISTVDRHLGRIYRHLGVRGRVEATRWAVAHGLAG